MYKNLVNCYTLAFLQALRTCFNIDNIKRNYDFKKIFKPVAKVLDKIIPNEIKPALPYLAAFAPVFGPTAGMFGNTMMKRALLSGGLNILGQLISRR